MGSGLEPAALELLPPVFIALMNRETASDIAEMPSLFCEFHGVSKAALQETADLTAEELCEECGATELNSASRKRTAGNCGAPGTRPGRPFTAPIPERKP